MSWRADFPIAWQDISKTAFLDALTDELRKPGTALNKLLAEHIRPGPMALRETAARLSANSGLNPDVASPTSARQSGPSPNP